MYFEGRPTAHAVVLFFLLAQPAPSLRLPEGAQQQRQLSAEPGREASGQRLDQQGVLLNFDTPRLQLPGEHVPILNNPNLWLLMGAVVLCIAATAVKIEVGSFQPGSAAEVLQRTHVIGRLHAKNMLHLMFCAVCLNISMLLWGISQEFVMNNSYKDAEGNAERVPSSLNMVLWNRLSTFVFSALLLQLSGNQIFSKGMWMTALPAASNALASWCQYASLHYISFALQTTAKTTKLLPVIIIDSLRGKPHSLRDYIEAFVLVMALVVFGLEVETARGAASMTTMTGVALIIVLILADSTTPHFQDLMFTKHPEMNPIQATFAMAGFASLGITLFQLCNGMLLASMTFVAHHPESMLHIAVLASSSTMTQYFITYTIKHHGPVVFTILASVRQVLSVGISALLFNHIIPPVGQLAMTVVFCMVISRAVRPFLNTLPAGDAEEATESSQPKGSREILIMGKALHAIRGPFVLHK